MLASSKEIFIVLKSLIDYKNKYTELESCEEEMIKVLNKSNNTVYLAEKITKTNNPKIDSYVFNEVHFLSILNHSAIPQIYDFFDIETEYIIIKDTKPIDNLNTLIKENEALDEFEVKLIINNLLGVVNYLHSNKISHRNITLENIYPIVINLDKFKLAGWKNARKFGLYSNTYTSSYYWSPEYIINDSYSYQSDIWCVGIIMFRLLLGYFPITSQNKVEIEKSLINNDIISMITSPKHSYISDESKDLLLSLLETNLEKRIDAEKALTHRFFYQLKIQYNNYSILSTIQDSSSQFEFFVESIKDYFAYFLYKPNSNTLILFNHLDSNQDGILTKKDVTNAVNGKCNVNKLSKKVFDCNYYQFAFRINHSKYTSELEPYLKTFFNEIKENEEHININDLVRLYNIKKDDQYEIMILKKMFNDMNCNEFKGFNFNEFKQLFKKYY